MSSAIAYHFSIVSWVKRKVGKEEIFSTLNVNLIPGSEFVGFHDTLKQLLEHRNLKQADLCRMTGIPTSLMSDYLGNKKSPTIGNAILIADALEISLDTLVGKESNQFHDKQQRTHLMNELCEMVKSLSEDEQLFLLDTVQALKMRLKKE